MPAWDTQALRWSKMGKIVEILPFRQYRIRLFGSGRVVLRNRRFLKLCTYSQTDTSPMLISNGSHIPPSISTDVQGDTTNSCTPAVSSSDSSSHMHNILTLSPTSSGNVNPNVPFAQPTSQHIPLILKRLQNHNNPGLKETAPQWPRRSGT